MTKFEPFFTAAVSHLELLGFTATFDELGANLTHASRPRLRVYPIENRVGFLAPFTVAETAKADVLGFCEFLNGLNGATTITKFYFFEQKSMMVQATYVGPYDKTVFGAFVDTFLQEVWQPRTVDPEGVKKFLQ